jgi:hypothetical protein
MTAIDGGLPLIGSDAAGTVNGRVAEIDDGLAVHGAVLLRGFSVDSPEALHEAASELCERLYGGYADLPELEAVSEVYRATPYPPDAVIEFHNEGSHLERWPTRQFLACRTPAPAGGETAVADGRRVLAELDSEIVSELRERGLRYVRHFHEGFDVPWQQFFGTEDRAAVPALCERQGLTARWLPSGTLRVGREAPAFRAHVVSGELLPFHQILLFHPAMLPEDLRELLVEALPAEEPSRDVTYGDGGAIPDEVATRIREVYESVAVAVRWERGDLLVIDNQRMAHSRRPYSGQRELFVAMGDMGTVPRP